MLVRQALPEKNGFVVADISLDVFLSDNGLIYIASSVRSFSTVHRWPHCKVKVDKRSRRLVLAPIGVLRAFARRVKARFLSWSASLWLGPGEALRDRHKGEVYTAPNSMRTLEGNLRKTQNASHRPPFFVLPCGGIINQEGLCRPRRTRHIVFCVWAEIKIVLDLDLLRHGVFVIVPNLCEMRRDGWIPCKRLFSQERGGL